MDTGRGAVAAQLCC